MVYLIDNFNQDVTAAQSGMFDSNVKKSIFIIFGVAGAFMISFNGEYRRLADERKESADWLNQFIE